MSSTTFYQAHIRALVAIVLYERLRVNGFEVIYPSVDFHRVIAAPTISRVIYPLCRKIWYLAISPRSLVGFAATLAFELRPPGLDWGSREAQRNRKTSRKQRGVNIRADLARGWAV